MICATIGCSAATRPSTSRAAGVGLDLAGAALGGAAEPAEQLRRGLAPAVVLAGEEPLQALLAQRPGVGRAGVALQERQRDRAVESAEDLIGPGQKRSSSARSWLVSATRVDQVLAGAAQRAQRLGLVAVGLKHPEAMAVGARQLAQHERVEPVGLAARDAEPRASRGDLVGVNRQHPQPRVQQPLDQQPVRALDRHQLDLQAHQLPAQRPQPRLVVRERRARTAPRRPRPARPRRASRTPSRYPRNYFPSYSSSVRSSQRPDHEVPLRALIDRPSTGYVLLPLAAPHPAGRGWSHAGPPTGKQRGPLPAAVEATTTSTVATT